MIKELITWKEFFKRLLPFDVEGEVIYGIPKGGMLATAFLKEATVTHHPLEATMFLDDVLDSGKTRDTYKKLWPKVPFNVLLNKQFEGLTDRWIVFPWEVHDSQMELVQDNIVRILQYIGENPNREGLVETPNRVMKSYGEIFSGYEVDVDSLFKIFEAPDNYDQIIISKFEFYSMCEHHMLPFYGTAYVGYIPNNHSPKVIGLSKLSRIFDAFAKRLQIQERLGDQMTEILMEKLQPDGAMCVIKAKHLCMAMRGANKQHSEMVTSSVKGVFREDARVKDEFLKLIE